jgi:hypothetical protein
MEHAESKFDNGKASIRETASKTCEFHRFSMVLYDFIIKKMLVFPSK